MTQGAAFFDLDRTLLRGSSAEIFSDAMRAAGLVSRDLPGQRLMYGVFNTIGETLPAMVLARQAVLVVKGHSRAAVAAASADVAPRLVELVQPFAHSVFAMHRDAERPLVLATTSPYDMVKPFADLLGFDDVVATKYGVLDDGDTYDGSLSGPFTWAAGKLEAVKAWAGAHDVDLSHSYAYSDSVYDSPLLGAVGFPMVVNPDPRMKIMAAARQWPVIDLATGAGLAGPSGGRPARTQPGSGGDPVRQIGLAVQKIAMSFARPSLVPYADIEITGTEHIPATGPVIIVGNHRSYFDPMVMGMVVARTGRTVHALGKKEVFDVPVFGDIAKALGGIRVDRATGSDEPLRAAAAVLDDGGLVMLMPQGTIPRGPAFFDPVLKGRWGAARLYQLTGATVVPVGLWGTELVWPRSSRLPNVFNIGDAPTVTATVGEPVALKGKSLKADTKAIMAAIVALLPPEARAEHVPTDEELARTYPPGYQGDPAREGVRRPGT